MQISKGVIPGAKKVVIYGPEGIGKSTFGSKFPDPVFCDTEGSTKSMDVSRFDKPEKWEDIFAAIKYVIENPSCCKTFIIDTADWAEMLCIKFTCDKVGVNGIEDFGYGKGYTYLQENFKKLIDMLDKLIELGINVVITAHAKMRKFEQPDEMGAYDRWEMKLTRQVAPMLKEWADILLFANYKTFVVEDDKTKSKKAQGGKRVMYTTHNPCWDAKNRYGLEDCVEFSYEAIKHIIEGTQPKKAPVKEAAKAPAKDPKEEKETKKKRAELTEKANIPEELKKLMIDNNITEWDIQNAVSSLKSSPYDSLVPIAEYDPQFIQSMLIDKFEGLKKKIQKFNKENEIPFKEEETK